MSYTKLSISNRRYIGSKTRILDRIEAVVKEFYKEGKFSFLDLFGGTGVVANHFSSLGCKVLVNDILYSNCVAYDAWLGSGKYDEEKVRQQLEKYNSLISDDLDENYFSETFGNKYFHNDDAKIVGYIREDLEKNKSKFTSREYNIILTSLLYATDKIANTCGHFESFLSKPPQKQGVILKELEIYTTEVENEIFCKDANELVQEVETDVVYIDPPYNARQYVNFYHVLENLACWQKPSELEGNSMKFKRNHLKSDYSRSKAPLVFENLIDNISAKLIIVSYNNTYNAKSGASNNKITENQLLSTLQKKGKVTKIEIPYKYFNAGKTNFENHKEYLFVCEVSK